MFSNNDLIPYANEIVIFTDRYFQCEPMDATISPIALTNHGNHAVTDNSNPDSINPGTPAPN